MNTSVALVSKLPIMKLLLFLLAQILICSSVFAQHQGHHMPQQKPPAKKVAKPAPKKAAKPKAPAKKAEKKVQPQKQKA